MADPQLETDAPLDGYATVRIGGEPVTTVGVRQGETVSVELTRDNPRDDD